VNRDILWFFHHIHHIDGKHEVHHCGGKHKNVDYTIVHCCCGLHRIDKEIAAGHDQNNKLVVFRFREVCPDGGWHIESGINGYSGVI